MKRRELPLFGLSFLDAMTCGFGAVVLFYMILTAAFGERSGRMTADLRAEADRLEQEVDEGRRNLVLVRNSLREVEREQVVTAGLAKRLTETWEAIEVELATYEDRTLARKAHVEKLKSDIRTLEEEVKRLRASAPSDETPGDRVRSFVGDGDRQYLTGLKVGGKRILFLVDGSASMLGASIVDVVRRRHLPDATKIRAPKWLQALSTADWLTTQIPTGSQFQLYVFSTRARAVVPGSEGTWLDGGDRKVVDDAVRRLREIVPGDGTSLFHAFQAIDVLRPAPDNVYLLTDGLPTQGRSPSRRATVSGKERLELFEQAVQSLRSRTPVNVILFPMEGDPMAPSAFWKLALATGGAYLSPSEDWP